MNNFNDFTNQYQISKTLRFELKPQGKTLEFIRQKGSITKDQERAFSYKIAKKVVDAYHRNFIDTFLEGIYLENIDEYEEIFGTKQDGKDKVKDKITVIENKLRKQIIDFIKKNGADSFKKLFEKDLFTSNILTDFILQSNNTYIVDVMKDLKITEKSELIRHIDEFKQFTTYFKGFHENRKNIYSSEDIPTSVAHRIVNENLPKYIINYRIVKNDIVDNPAFADELKNMENELDKYLNGKTIKQFFSLENYCNTITQKQIDCYNTVIGGLTKPDGTKIQGLNEHINLFNQKHSKDKDYKPIPKLKPLYKQILSKRSDISFIPEQYDNDKELLESISEFYKILNDNCLYLKADTYDLSIIELINKLDEFDLEKIYIKNDESITSISNYIFGDWSIISTAMKDYFDLKDSELRPEKIKLSYIKGSEIHTKKYIEEKDKFFRNQDCFAIALIDKSLDSYIANIDNDDVKKIWSQLGSVAKFFKKMTIKRKKDNKDVDIELISKIKLDYNKVKDILQKDYPNNKLNMDDDAKEKIKSLLDSISNLQHFLKPLFMKEDIEKDLTFYNPFEELYEILSSIIPLYNKVRNYLTRKTHKVEKIKLNFEKPTLLDGWDVNKETANLGVLLRKDNKYYLAIMDGKNNKSFEKKLDTVETDYFEKIDYKLLAGPNKMLPKVFFSAKRIKEFNPSDEILANYKNETHKKGDKFNLQHCHQLIDFFKDAISRHPDWKHFEHSFSPTESYKDISMFYREVEHQGYKMSFRRMPESYINQLVDEGKLYLFQIYNKDFSEYSKGKPNLHTIYWKMLFDQDNLKDVVYKLNGEAELFYRKPSIPKENVVIHKANEPILNKNKYVAEKKKHSTFNYDLIKDKRFTTEKFHFHVPITLNFKAVGQDNINFQVRDTLKNSYDTHIIGIDRGERHLLYLSLIDRNGNIIKQHSLNEILYSYKDKDNDDIEVKTNYKELLDKKEDERMEARKNWKTIGNIKELKEGYLSQVVHQIAKMMVDYNAIVVLEDLNYGFKNSRIKVDKQVYQNFEKMLIEKLNYLVFKDVEADQPSGALKALQLSSKFESFKKLGKQSGFLFYLPAWNTSKIDPTTGFTVLFNHKDLKYESIEKSQNFFAKFKSIKFNNVKNYFEFEFDYSDFTDRAERTKSNWTVCTEGDRIETFRNKAQNSQWDSHTINLNDKFQSLFADSKIIYADGNDLKEQIAKQTDKKFFADLIKLFNLTLQMRNSKSKTEEDYMISPVMNDEGEFYDSRIAGKTLPENADANGAYNIARKGLMLLKLINNHKDNNWKDADLDVSNKRWLAFAQGDDNWTEIESTKSKKK